MLVRRPVRPNTQLVRDVLDRLGAAGMCWAPRFVGVEGREEVLGWLPGIVLDVWPSNIDRLERLATIVRDLHDLTSDITEADCIIHDDLQPRNVVVHGDSLGLIDWEQLRPGRRVDDVAQLCWSFAGPAAGEDVAAVGRRWRQVLDAYGMKDRGDVVAASISKIRRGIDDIVDGAQQGSDRHLQFLERGDDSYLRATLDWLLENRQAMTSYLETSTDV